MPTPLTLDRARRFLVAHCGLDRDRYSADAAGVRALLAARRCIQLDPLDRIGTNADLVCLARIPDLYKGDVYRHLLPGAAFEHFAKERCLLPASAFPAYRDQAAETPWWRLAERYQRVPAPVIADVLAEVSARGPLAAAELTDRGRVTPIDWHGWKSTSRMATMALQILWTRCQVVVCARRGRDKVYDVPDRALPAWARRPAPTESFGHWGAVERVAAAGLLKTAGGPQWSVLSPWRKAVTRDLVAEGALTLYQLPDTRRTWLGPPDLLDRSWPEPDDRMRILGPLDPLLWDRVLVQRAFDFTYLWEVYKPAAQRRWGYYVCPLLHRGRLVGRVEAHVQDGRVVVDQLWREDPGFDEGAWRRCLDRHEAAVCAVGGTR